MSEELSRRIAIVTGASRGLGREVALRLADHHFHVVAVARDEQRLSDVCGLITRSGGKATPITSDIADEKTVERLAKGVDGLGGAVSVLVNAAGVFGPIATIAESDPKRWMDTIRINLLGPYLTCRAFAGRMIAAGWGRMINFSSAAAFHPPGPLNGAYGTSKVALNHFTRHLAAELAGTGVTANVIHPGEVRTDMWAEIQAKSAAIGDAAAGFRQWAQWVEQTGGDDPQKAADLVLRLVSHEAAQISGQFLWIENGLQTPLPGWGEAKNNI